MKCRVCDGEFLELVIDLGEQPWCNHFLKFDEMGKCFWWLNCCLACYGVAIFFAAWILLNAVLHGARP